MFVFYLLIIISLMILFVLFSTMIYKNSTYYLNLYQPYDSLLPSSEPTDDSINQELIQENKDCQTALRSREGDLILKSQELEQYRLTEESYKETKASLDKEFDAIKAFVDNITPPPEILLSFPEISSSLYCFEIINSDYNINKG